jgi:hypothetical protein
LFLPLIPLVKNVAGASSMRRCQMIEYEEGMEAFQITPDSNPRPGLRSNPRQPPVVNAAANLSLFTRLDALGYTRLGGITPRPNHLQIRQFHRGKNNLESFQNHCKRK